MKREAKQTAQAARLGREEATLRDRSKLCGRPRGLLAGGPGELGAFPTTEA